MVRTTRSSAAKAESTPTSVKDSKQGRKQASHVKQEPSTAPANISRKRSRKTIKEEDRDGDELPHNLGTTSSTSQAEHEYDDQTTPRKRTRRTKAETEVDEVKVKMEEIAESTPAKKTSKKANYGLTPGISPFPNYEHPTPEECREVVRILEKRHGKVTQPEAPPTPSLTTAGCGNVPSVLDALVRTRLSANTTNSNSSTAFQGLVKAFGTLKEGVGKGSVDWDAVRRAPNHDVFKAIERGGLARVKSKDIQAILQMAYEENQERKSALLDSSDDPAGAEGEPESEKQEEISKAKQNVISLDHIHLLSTDDAIKKMLTYPGIGPKTASCVALFCLRRPSFAVDTHVFRLCQYLGWVPSSTKKGQPKVDRNTTYSHCDVRIPDELKYPLHYLLIKHGKICPRCRAATSSSSADWAEGCPIEHLVKRHGAKKGGMSAADRKKAKEAAAEGDEAAAEAEDEELSGASQDAEDQDE